MKNAWPAVRQSGKQRSELRASATNPVSKVGALKEKKRIGNKSDVVSRMTSGDSGETAKKS
jgi:hypothetical protein